MYHCAPTPKKHNPPQTTHKWWVGGGETNRTKREGENGRKGLLVKPFVNIVFSNVGRETVIVFGIGCTLVYLRPKFVEIGNRNFKS